MIAIVNYGVGNLFSLESSFNAINQNVKVTSSPHDLMNAERIILPGVGAFGDAAGKLFSSGLARLIIDEARKGKPVLGICLGMQLLFTKSYEFGEHDGLNLIPGEIRAISKVIPAGLKIPQMGWNSLAFTNYSPIYSRTPQDSYVYFVHSYSAFCDEKYITATTDYGAPLTASVQNGNVYGVQYHPEKSGSVGLDILRAFCEVKS
ncbi:MAG: imidazole glycerol phosphate synthase subunit HisH [Synergistaceae bacterium]|nr:imidazole glycerol phosphate synthase subunit HisH [Synergistaceae bacterium]